MCADTAEHVGLSRDAPLPFAQRANTPFSLHKGVMYGPAEMQIPPLRCGMTKLFQLKHDKVVRHRMTRSVATG